MRSQQQQLDVEAGTTGDVVVPNALRSHATSSSLKKKVSVRPMACILECVLVECSSCSRAVVVLPLN